MHGDDDDVNDDDFDVDDVKFTNLKPTIKARVMDLYSYEDDDFVDLIIIMKMMMTMMILIMMMMTRNLFTKWNLTTRPELWISLWPP